jgi:hypothetical protein
MTRPIDDQCPEIILILNFCSPMISGPLLIIARAIVYYNNVSGRLQIYDPETDEWTQSVALTGFRLGFCAAATEDFIYIFGGFDQDGGKKRTERLDLEKMTWSRMADMAANRTSLACVNYQDGFVVAGGWGESEGPNAGDVGVVNTVEYYDIAEGIVLSPAIKKGMTTFKPEFYSRFRPRNLAKIKFNRASLASGESQLRPASLYKPAQICALPASCRCLFQILHVSISNFTGVHFKF